MQEIYPILILRSEIMCMIILVFIALASKRYKMGKDNTIFARLLICAIIHVIFDIITVLTINKIIPTSDMMNKTIHVFFYLSALMFSSEFLHYILNLVKPNKKIANHIISYIFVVLYAIIVWFPFMTIELYDWVGGTYASSGIAAIAGYGCAFINFIYGFILMFLYRKKIKENIMATLFPMTFVAILLVVFQIFVQSLLFTGAAVTIITIGFFFSSDSPAQVFKQKNKDEALSLIKTNAQYKEDLIKYNEEFIKNKEKNFVFIQISIDNLSNVNDSLGHLIGDDYILQIVESAVHNFKDAVAIYRINGPDFSVVYRESTEEIVKNDIRAFNTDIKVNSSSAPYETKVSIGYAISNDNYNNINEVISAVSYSLYTNRESSRDGSEMIDVEGVSINVTGLNNFMFDALLIADNNDHPYIINLNTNVMRITPKWKEEFGLPNDIMYDLATTWINHIHPDDRQKFIDDFTAAVNGNKPTHDCDYRAMNKDGKYIKCSCHGAPFKDEDGNLLFAGHMYTLGEADSD